MSRNLKFNKDLLSKITGYIEGGLSNKDAAKLVGICESTFYKWQSNDNDNPLSEAQKTEFMESMDIARVKRRYTLTRRILEASKKQWRAGAWYLERTCPEEFAKKEPKYIKVEESVYDDISDESVDIFNLAVQAALTGEMPTHKSHILRLSDKLNIKESLRFI